MASAWSAAFETARSSSSLATDVAADPRSVLRSASVARAARRKPTVSTTRASTVAAAGASSHTGQRYIEPLAHPEAPVPGPFTAARDAATAAGYRPASPAKRRSTSFMRSTWSL